MAENILLSALELQSLQADGACLVVDCRFSLEDPDAGYRNYLESRIPGAVYAHLDDDLSGPRNEGSGRHPLPGAELFADFLGRIGWQPGVSLIVYDDVSGAIAARLWWLMKYFGHDACAMLDGGISAWREAGFPLEVGPADVEPMPVADYHVRDDLVVSSSELVEYLGTDRYLLVDARTRERFDGESEPIDPVAGHIPGAVNHPYTLNLTPDGLFKPTDEIREGLLKLEPSQEKTDLVHMCGSGVTACHNIFAVELAGSTRQKLYVGSWSEWIQDPTRPTSP